MSIIKVHCLGQFNATLGPSHDSLTFPTARTEALFIYLLAHKGQPQRRAYLADLIWSERHKQPARTNLRKTFSRLRQLAKPHKILISDRHEATLNDTLITCDLWRFESLLTQARSTNDQTKIDLLTTAVTEYQGDFANDFNAKNMPLFEEWLLLAQRTYQQQFLDSLTTIVQFYAQQMAWDQLLHYAQLYIQHDYWHEQMHRHLLTALQNLGRTAAALAHYQTYHQNLAAELGITPEPDTITLIKTLKSHQPQITPTNPPTTTQWHNFPRTQTTFIGRQTPLKEIDTLLQTPEIRLLNIIGAGGMGKTRLAIKATLSLPPTHFTAGIYFIPCQTIQTIDAFFPHLASYLHYELDGQQTPQQQIIQFLAQKPILLLLDNFEQLATIAPQLLSPILNQTQTTLLITSRHALNLAEEWRFPLTGLQAGAHLFKQRAHRYGLHQFTPADDDIIDDLITLVQGMPLAIEMAAAWLRVYSLSDLQQYLHTNLDMWVTPHANQPPRHRSLDAVFDGSWRLLTPQLRTIMTRLSILHNHFTSQAAEYITQATKWELAQLIDYSLLFLGDNGRYHLHPLIKQLAHQKLTPQNHTETATRHAHYYLEHLAQTGATLRGPQSRPTLRQLRPDFDNIRLAWQWVTTHPNLPAAQQLAPLAAPALTNYFLLHGSYTDGAQALTPVAPLHAAELLLEKGDFKPLISLVNQTLSPNLSPNDLLHAHTLLSAAHRQLGQYTDAATHLQTVEACLSTATNPLLIANWQVEQALLHMFTGQPQHSQPLLTQALTTYETHQDLWAITKLLSAWSKLAAMTHQDARPYFLEILTIQKQIGTPTIQQSTLSSLALSSMYRGDYPAALNYCQQSLDICQQQQYQLALTENQLLWGRIKRRIGRFQEADDIYHHTYNQTKQNRWHQLLIPCLIERALLAHHHQQYQQSLAWCQEASYYLDRTHFTMYLSLITAQEGHVLLTLGHYPQAQTKLETALQHQIELHRPGREMHTRGLLALLYQKQAQPDLAQAQVEKILTYLNQTKLHKSDDPLYMEWCCYSVLHHNQDKRAYPLLTQLYSKIQQQADALDNANQPHDIWAIPHHQTIKAEIKPTLLDLV
ncbi:MAG TPA: BTAD domain-containing putative transcriptional regulator [Anaerolineae bacterium]|nr:BTAD domain-containing putative transcriptional regulator [Anaerolineae bacterium]